MPKHGSQALVSALARRFTLPAKARAQPVTAKRPAPHFSEPKAKKTRISNASQEAESVQLEDGEAADKSDAQIGPASETDVEHLARHSGGHNDGCPRCKLLGSGRLQ